MDAKDVEIANKDHDTKKLTEQVERLRSGLAHVAAMCNELIDGRATRLVRTHPTTPKVADATPDVAAPQPVPSGLRWGVRHKATGGIVARFRCGDTACGYINLGYSVGRWHSDDLELVDLAPAPVETPAQPPTSTKSH